MRNEMVMKFPAFIEPEGSQVPISEPYPEPVE
jgi:hypothetical protein